jgi:polyisoprenoid-binding protein YceI
MIASHTRWLVLIAVAGLMLSAAPASAAPSWAVNKDESTVGFTAKWEDVPFDGVFHRYEAETLQFTPDDLDTSRFAVTVDVTTADTDNRDRDEAMADPDWFHFAQYRRAQFQSTGFEAIGDNRFEVTGKLTIKDVTRTIQFPFTWKRQGDTAQLTGEMTMDRRDFNIGEGQWSSGRLIRPTVTVRVDLQLQPA